MGNHIRNVIASKKIISVLTEDEVEIVLQNISIWNFMSLSPLWFKSLQQF